MEIPDPVVGEPDFISISRNRSDISPFILFLTVMRMTVGRDGVYTPNFRCKIKGPLQLTKQIVTTRVGVWAHARYYVNRAKRCRTPTLFPQLY